MSLREDMEKAMSEVIKESHVENVEVANFVKEHFHKIFKHSKKTNTSIKTAVIESLKGIEDGFKAGGYESKELVQKVASEMLEMGMAAAEKRISAARHTVDVSKNALNEELKKANESIDQVKQKTKDEITTAYSKLQEESKTAKEHLSQMSEGLKEYAEKKSYATLNKIAEKSKEAVYNIKQSAKENSKQLLHHTQGKIADWLKNMANKIEQK